MIGNAAFCILLLCINRLAWPLLCQAVASILNNNVQIIVLQHPQCVMSLASTSGLGPSSYLDMGLANNDNCFCLQWTGQHWCLFYDVAQGTDYVDVTVLIEIPLSRLHTLFGRVFATLDIPCRAHLSWM